MYSETISLPERIAILPLEDGVLMPRAYLSLPLQELHQLNLLADAVQNESMLGVVQIRSGEDNQDDFRAAQLFSTGTLAKILEINDHNDNRVHVSLGGIARFTIREELEQRNGYRYALVDYDKYNADMAQVADFDFNRERLMRALRIYFNYMDITPNWHEIEQASNEKLITALSMVCPFERMEKQAILELPTLQQQSEILTSMIEFAPHAFNGIISTVH